MIRRFIAIILALSLFALPAIAESFDASKARAVEYLRNRLYDGVDSIYVYRDFSAADNHFIMRAKIDSGKPHHIDDMEENWTENPYSGATCIRCRVNKVDTNWGGWMFLTGRIPEDGGEPEANLGEFADCGYDLSGATSLSFRARGERGGEIAEFFTAGLGWDENESRLLTRHPDSSNTVSLGFVHLTDEWREYTISLSYSDLSYISRGFGFICTGIYASGEHVIYLDDIRFNGLTERNMKYPRFIPSYETNIAERPGDLYLQNAAFSNDNALAAMAFLSEGLREEAKTILDAFAYAIEHDRYKSDRVRNAYAYGSVEPIPGFGGVSKLPGVYDLEQNAYVEDADQVGVNPGTTAHVALALMQYDRLYGAPEYAALACRIVDFVLVDCEGGEMGYTAGYVGWPESGEASRYTHKSIEHNIGLYAACRRLYELTGEARYQDACARALRLIDNLYDGDRRCFLSDTEDDGITLARGPVLLGAQFRAALALGEAFAPYADVLETAKDLRARDGLFPYSDAQTEGAWLEGTALAALAFAECGMEAEAVAALGAAEAHQLKSGGFPASNVESYFTGLYLESGEELRYSDAPHIAAAAWYVLAGNGFNPYGF